MARIPATLAGYLSRDLSLATSNDPAVEVAVRLKASGISLTGLVDVGGFTVVPGAHAGCYL